MVGHVTCTSKINGYKVLVGRCEEKRPLGELRLIL
jgi:hypothetical protein